MSNGPAAWLSDLRRDPTPLNTWAEYAKYGNPLTHLHVEMKDLPARGVDSQGYGMDIVAVEYRGFVITHPAVPIHTAGATVQVASDNTHLLSRLLGRHVFEDPRGQERAVAKAKRYIDVVLGDTL
jgi:hypothetical protein